MVEPKNPIRLIEVANIIIKKNNKIRFAIIGDGEMKNKIQNMIDDYNLGDNVTMLGYQFNPYPYLKNAKILIMTSKYEGTPMCALEALSLGLIVVSTPVDGLKDIIIDKKNGFLLNSNEEIANKVLEILNDDILMEEMSKNSKKIFNQTNNINKYIEIMRKVYN